MMGEFCSSGLSREADVVKKSSFFEKLKHRWKSGSGVRVAKSPRNAKSSDAVEARLDQGLDDRPFSEGSGHDVESLPYRRRDAVEDDVDVAGLIKAVKMRLQTPLLPEAQ